MICFAQRGLMWCVVCRMGSLPLLLSENVSAFIFLHPSSKSFFLFFFFSTFHNVKLVSIFLSLPLPVANPSLLFLFPSGPVHFADNSGECYLVRALSSVGSLVKSIGIVEDLIILTGWGTWSSKTKPSFSYLVNLVKLDSKVCPVFLFPILSLVDFCFFQMMDQ